MKKTTKKTACKHLDATPTVGARFIVDHGRVFITLQSIALCSACGRVHVMATSDVLNLATEDLAPLLSGILDRKVTIAAKPARRARKDKR
jgi:hypothetical protein